LTDHETAFALRDYLADWLRDYHVKNTTDDYDYLAERLIRDGWVSGYRTGGEGPYYEGESWLVEKIVTETAEEEA
jgi:hypothetical protein